MEPFQQEKRNEPWLENIGITMKLVPYETTWFLPNAKSSSVMSQWDFDNPIQMWNAN